MKALLVTLVAAATLTVSCKKSSTAVDTPVTKPRVGSKFTYRYKTFYPSGLILSSQDVVYSITAEVTLGGEKWFQFSDPSGAPWLLLNVKTGGLYQYANNASNLLCKYPAVRNETYTAYNNGAVETFTAKAIDSILVAPIADIKVNMVESTVGGYVTGYNFYNPDYWLVKREVWQVYPVLGGGFVSNRQYRWELTTVVY
jgi:hypothetical protein